MYEKKSGMHKQRFTRSSVYELLPKYFTQIKIFNHCFEKNMLQCMEIKSVASVIHARFENQPRDSSDSRKLIKCELLAVLQIAIDVILSLIKSWNKSCFSILVLPIIPFS